MCILYRVPLHFGMNGWVSSLKPDFFRPNEVIDSYGQSDTAYLPEIELKEKL